MASTAASKKTPHTLIMSDLHLTEAEPVHKHNPLWKRYKRRRYFIDRTFARLLAHMDRKIKGPIELVLNGDIFDFDSLTSIPTQAPFSVSWLERRRGLASEEPKSLFKIRRILSDHVLWVQALKEFLDKGNTIIFVIGNHDLELHWPAVQDEIRFALGPKAASDQGVRFCEWFYVSNRDTLIEHGNQYDPYCLCSNPIHPLIRKGFSISVRLPFGNLAGRFMMNGMGLFNPHVESNFIMTASEYLRFFFRYMLRTQPFLMGTWFWGAMVTLVYSIGEGLLPAMKDPLTTEGRIAQIAHKAHTSPRVVRLLRELHVHPAIYDPFKILRELWLDRALLFLLICLGSLQLVALVNVFFPVSVWWILVPLGLFMPFFIFYARSVRSDLARINESIALGAPMAARIAKVNRVVHGHTHRSFHASIEEVEIINTGNWSPSFTDPECTTEVGSKLFCWIQPAPDQEGSGRTAQLWEWIDPTPYSNEETYKMVLVEKSPPLTKPSADMS